MSIEQEACQEFARNIGEEFSDRAWLLTSFDTWERNPHYKGPSVPHPEDDEPWDTDGPQEPQYPADGFGSTEMDDVSDEISF